LGKSENVVHKKSFDFALKIVRVVKLLESDRKEYVLSKQLLRSGTAIGALIREGEHAESKKDFIHKMSIALKEANETRYWLDLLAQSNIISKTDLGTLGNEVTELIRILASIVKSSKNNLK